jgi:hypothetical protein
MATSWRPTPTKPPAPMMAKDTALSGATMRSSIRPTFCLFSLYTVLPRICFFTLQPTATTLSSSTATPSLVDPAVCAPT